MPIDVLPHIYRYGYAFPFYNISGAIRTIIFGTKNERKHPCFHVYSIRYSRDHLVGLHFGILLAWVGDFRDNDPTVPVVHAKKACG